MKVLLVTQYFFPENFPINALVSSLGERKIEVEILTGQPNYPSGRIFPGYKAWHAGRSEWNGKRVYRMPLIPRGEKSALSLLANYASFVISGMLVAPCLLFGRRYDAIFVYAPSPILQAIPALFLARFKRAPVTLWVQDLWPESLSATGYVRNKAALGAVDRLVRWIYRHCDLLLGQSQSFVREIAAKSAGTPVRYLPNSVDPIFEQADLASEAAVELHGCFSVVFTGNVGVAQAVEVILEAATLLRDETGLRIVIYGTGSRWNWLSEQVQARGLQNLILAGQRPLQAMPAIMRQASVLLVTLADEPTFAYTIPSKVQAYMSAGRPIVGSLNGEGANLIEQAKAGHAVPAGDSGALAAVLLALYRQAPEERETMGENARRYYCEHFEHEKLVDQLISLLDESKRKAKD